MADCGKFMSSVRRIFIFIGKSIVKKPLKLNTISSALLEDSPHMTSSMT